MMLAEEYMTTVRISQLAARFSSESELDFFYKAFGAGAFAVYAPLRRGDLFVLVAER